MAAREPISIRAGAGKWGSPWRHAVGSVFLLAIIARTVVEAAEIGCSNVKYAYSAHGFNGVAVPRQPVPGNHLRICQQGETCCTEEMEDNYNNFSQQEFQRILKQSIELLKNTFAARAAKFDDYFQELLKSSKTNFHAMFIRTYGTIYEKNSHVFTDLFESLERYHTKGNVNLGDALENFFVNLYQKMFQVLNAQYSYDQKFLNCMQEFMDDLKPFGDVPQKLTIQVRRAFVAARTFVQALQVGRDVVKAMIDVPATPECNRAFMKMTYCPTCRGYPDLKPCNSYCLNVMKGCLAYQTELHTAWNDFIESTINLADRLEGPFNIEPVVEPINIKISDAIMNFQENGVQVSAKIFENCGKPPLGKRDVSRELNYDTLKFPRQDGSSPRMLSTLDKLVKDIRNKIKVTKSFWHNLPYQMCNNEKIADVKLDDDCWNGLTRAKYEPKIAGDGFDNQKDNPEVHLDTSKSNILLNQQILNLNAITSKLKNAYNGLDVDWPDADWSGSGSGSGDDGGSGDGSNVDKDHYFPPSTTSTAKPKPEVRPAAPTRPAAAGASSRMTLQKALDVFVLPVMLCWLGSMF